MFPNINDVFCGSVERRHKVMAIMMISEHFLPCFLVHLHVETEGPIWLRNDSGKLDALNLKACNYSLKEILLTTFVKVNPVNKKVTALAN
jgi:hypothetical protein